MTGLTAALALTGCAGSAAQKQSQAAGGSGGGMIGQLTFPSEADAAVGGLVNFNPIRAQAVDVDVALRAAHRAQCPHV